MKNACTSTAGLVGAPVSAAGVDRLGVAHRPGGSDGYTGSQTYGQVAQPCLVVTPKSSQDIVSLLDWAHGQGTKLTTFSSARGPRERGLTSAVPTVVMDLSGMDRVLHVDARDPIAIIEPGVTYAALDDALAPHGLRAMRPLAPRPGKSVIASALEREPAVQVDQHWDVLDPMGSAEIVFGSGEVFRTGTAAIPGTMSEHLRAGLRYLTAYGPRTVDFLRVLQGAQGTLGVVTWAAVMCDRVPALEKSYFVADTDTQRLVALLSWMHWRRLGNATWLGNALQLATLAGRDSTEIQALQRRLPPWACWIRLGHGGSEFPQEQLALELEELQAHAATLGLRVEESLPGLPASAIDSVQAEAACDVYQDRLRGAHRSVFFLHQLDQVPRFVIAAQTLLTQHAWPQEQLAVYVQPRLQGRNAHIEFVLPCPAPGTEDDRRARCLASQLARCAADLGGFFSRPYGEWAALAYARNVSLQPYLRQTKRLLDPEQLLNSGRLCF